MRLRSLIAAGSLSCLIAITASATVLSTLHGVVHDPQHLPVAGAEVTLHAVDSSFQLTATTDALGSFDLPAAPLGTYRLHVAAAAFATQEEIVTIQSGTHPVLHFSLQLASVKTTISVETPLEQVDSVTPTTTISREQIAETPGSDRATSFAFITDYVPGTYVTHDMLHMRGGHQTSWLIDGVSIPNTNIASNVGPQIDPSDINSIEVQRGSYASDVGDRTYGVFNVLPRSGFERDRAGELSLAGGNLGTGSIGLSLGDHSARTAWYTGLAGSRSNYGLQTPIAAIDHDATNSQSAFVSVLSNLDPKNQLRTNAQFREDYFQVPFDPNPDSFENQQYNSSGFRDGQTERDSFLLTSWVHTYSPRAMLEVSPFYHYNLANYDSNDRDLPTSTTWHRTSNYAGLQADINAEVKRNHISTGIYTFGQHDSYLFGVLFNDHSSTNFSQPSSASGGLMDAYLSDNYRPTEWLTLLAGLRFQSFQGTAAETYVTPRFGASLTVPKLQWVLRGFYGRFYQAPPLLTITGRVLDYAHGADINESYAPLHGERDEEHQFGIQIPYHGWVLDVDTFKTRINNFLDHNNLGESNIFFPISVDGALVRAWEATVRSPRVAKLGQFHLAYSNQIAEQRGAILGGLICVLPGTQTPCPVDNTYTPVDHDQRDTLNTGFVGQLPYRSWFSTNVYYGSGFSNGLAGVAGSPYNGNYLPVHTTFDVAAGRSFGERWNATAHIVNVTNHRVLLDNSLTIGGFHYNDPRMISAELRYRFHF